jgi:NitT/TauT family transport system permease protein
MAAETEMVAAEDALAAWPGAPGAWRERLSTLAWRLALLVLLAGLWQMLTATGMVDLFWVSSPTAIVVDLYKQFSSGEIFAHIWITLYETFLGFAAGAVGGIACGFALARWERANRILDPYVSALNSLPRVALAPLFILWFGIGIASKVVLAFSLVVFILLINTYAGAKNVDQDLVIITRLLGATERQLLVKVVLPSCIPWIFAGLRLGLAYALIGAVVGEVIVAQAGLGYLISYNAGTFNTTGVFSVLIVLMAISMVLNECMRWVERKLLHWRPQQFMGA